MCKYFAVFLFISVSPVSLICVYLLFIALSIVVTGLLFQGFCAVFCHVLMLLCFVFFLEFSFCDMLYEVLFLVCL
ncbi:putative membrane protein [Synechococcus sp. A18-40]|nr:putative membrane protein [Synechococcus sp. A18-40]